MLINALSLPDSAASPWQECLARIYEKVGPSTFETWFRSTDMVCTAAGSVSIEVPNRFFADFIEQHFSVLIRETLAHESIPCEKLCFTPTDRDWKVIEPIRAALAEAYAAKSPVATDHPQQFHPSYRFESFVIGDTNRMAHAAALAVAEAPGKTSFNPLIVYGGTGLGKTHLLQAIGHFSQSESAAENVVYMTSEEFTSQYISHVRDNKDSTSFYRRFSHVDLLLIDDIQFFSGKHGTQKEFFRIFNKLLMENKQIVLSSDRPPDQIPDMMAHILNRFMAGLVTDIQPPNLETRMAILRKKAEVDGLYLSPDVTEYIACHITSNVRELEGTLIKLIASCSFTGRDISLDVASEICGDALSQQGRRLTLRFIQQKVAEFYGISPNQLTIHSRKRDGMLPRYIAMYLAKKWTKQSMRSIGLEFGMRDYSTVIHASKKIEAAIKIDGELGRQIEAIEDQIRPLA